VGSPKQQLFYSHISREGPFLSHACHWGRLHSVIAWQPSMLRHTSSGSTEYHTEIWILSALVARQCRSKTVLASNLGHLLWMLLPSLGTVCCPTALIYIQTSYTSQTTPLFTPLILNFLFFQRQKPSNQRTVYAKSRVFYFQAVRTILRSSGSSFPTHLRHFWEHLMTRTALHGYP
jgi:hypothetical protein